MQKAANRIAIHALLHAKRRQTARQLTAFWKTERNPLAFNRLRTGAAKAAMTQKKSRHDTLS